MNEKERRKEGRREEREKNFTEKKRTTHCISPKFVREQDEGDGLNTAVFGTEAAKTNQCSEKLGEARHCCLSPTGRKKIDKTQCPLMPGP